MGKLAQAGLNRRRRTKRFDERFERESFLVFGAKLSHVNINDLIKQKGNGSAKVGIKIWIVSLLLPAKKFDKIGCK